MGGKDVIALTLSLAFDDNGIRGVGDGPVNVEGSSRLNLQMYGGSATYRGETTAEGSFKARAL